MGVLLILLCSLSGSAGLDDNGHGHHASYSTQPHSDFNFRVLLLQAICIEGQLDDEDTVGQEMDLIPPSPIPEPSQHGINVEFDGFVTGLLRSYPIPPAAERGIYDAQRHKQKLKQKWTAQCKSAKAVKPYAILTSLNVLHLPHMQGAYTGARAQGQEQKALSLQDLIGIQRYIIEVDIQPFRKASHIVEDRSALAI
ncbi:uncharacterized protein LAESUDRAFT_718124 [Laetiporus sulphureus 93-53]|uniref:Uncharacterized protein n=1 Tax=Laetiporus sulphureus 93-53 TaxID=1314785 RepID=A0A165B7Z6_9APHY|nr:uncharacterized protein LAESUDRAFT_718124 [Laetiporus sulphureus 93-53]KZT00453.1 hypothetical protein LAESUDRAFT_718124 [Laetiporus sulphureus 93-53]